MSTPFQQKAVGPMTYPSRGTLNRLLFKTPLIWWRMGLGPVLGQAMLVLTTWGRKSKLPRWTMLSYTLYDGRAYLLSGWGDHTDWYRNTLDNPHVTVQRGAHPYSAVARRVTDVEEYAAVAYIMFQTGGDSHFRPWLESLAIDYDVNDLIAKRDRVYMVALDPTDEPGPLPMPSDLTWVWGAIVSSFTAGWLLGRWGRNRK